MVLVSKYDGTYYRERRRDQSEFAREKIEYAGAMETTGNVLEIHFTSASGSSQVQSCHGGSRVAAEMVIFCHFFSRAASVSHPRSRSETLSFCESALIKDS